MDNYATYLEKVLRRKVWKYRNFTITFDKVEQEPESGSYDFYVSVNSDEDESFLSTQVLDKIELIIKNAFRFLTHNDNEYAFSIFATYNNEYPLQYGKVYLSEKDENEIIENYNFYMKFLRKLGVSQRLLKVIVDNGGASDEVHFKFFTKLGLPQGKTIRDLPMEAIQNAMYETIETLLTDKFTDDEGQGVTFTVRINTQI